MFGNLAPKHSLLFLLFKKKSLDIYYYEYIIIIKD
jgi:hypothetical protein